MKCCNACILLKCTASTGVGITGVGKAGVGIAGVGITGVGKAGASIDFSNAATAYNAALVLHLRCDTSEGLASIPQKQKHFLLLLPILVFSYTKVDDDSTCKAKCICFTTVFSLVTTITVCSLRRLRLPFGLNESY